MMRGISTVMGFFLLGMWIAGVAIQDPGPWMYWLDLVAAVLAWDIAYLASPRATKAVRSAPPILLSLGLFAMWIVGLCGVASPIWLRWCNFGVACVLFIAGCIEMLRHRRELVEVTQVRRTA